MTKIFKPEWIRQGITRECIEFADELGAELISGGQQHKLTTSQIRNIFGELKRIEMKGFSEQKSSFLLLKPKMAYAAGRHKSRGIKAFRKVFNQAFDEVDVQGEQGKLHFKNFVDFFEAILAYHKFHDENLKNL